MAITYNENDNSLEIKDTLKTRYWITNVSLIFMIINCILFPAFILEKQQMEWFGFIWILIGIASVIALIYQILKVSATENLKLSEIHSLEERQFLGKKSISLQLKNGKFRDLTPMQNESELIKKINFFKNIDIKIT